MPSLRSRLFLFALKHRHWWHGGSRWPSDLTSPAAIVALRRIAAGNLRLLGTLPADATVEPVAIGALEAEWIRPAGADADRVLLYFHGGGYVMGDCRTHRSIVAKFAQGSRTAALVFSYRLAPEHPFPAALDDALAAYDWLRQQGVAAASIVFAGDSAGGGLLLATLLALRQRGEAMPAAAVALSPWTDLACTGASYVTNLPTEVLAPKGCWTAFSAHYLAGADPRDPLISPLYGDLAGLPPLLIFAGGHEVMRDDSVAFAERARTAGVAVTLRVGAGLFHCYPACAPLFPEATEAMAEICAFIRAAGNSVTPRRR